MKKSILLTMTAMMAALACVATMVIKVPTVGTNGYVNIGDVAVLLAAWVLGNPYGAVAAGLGSAMADLLSGYASYVPGTFVIKFAMAFVGYIVFVVFKKTKMPQVAGYIVSSLVAEIIMIVGYFAYESTLLGYGLGAAASIPSNAVQGITCLVIANLLIQALKKIPYVKAIINKEANE